MTNYSSKLPQNVIRIYDISHLKDYASKIFKRIFALNIEAF